MISPKEQVIFPEWNDYFAKDYETSDEQDGLPGLEQIIQHGLHDKKCHAAPASHLSSIVSHIIFAETRELLSFDTLLAPFIKTDSLTYKEIYQCMQMLVFSLSFAQKGRIYIQLDYTCPEHFCSKKAVVGGYEMDFTYGSCQAEMTLLDDILMAVLKSGDSEKQPFTCIALKKDSEEIHGDFASLSGRTYEMFTQKNSPKCDSVRDFMALTAMEGTEISIDSEQGFTTASEKGVFVTPTVIFYNQNNEELVRAHNIHELESSLILLKDKK